VERNLRERAEKYVPLAEHDVKLISIEGTEFLIAGRKQGGIGLKRIESAVFRFWPSFVVRLGRLVPNAVILDFDAPLGGGPFENFVVGVYSSDNVSSEHQQLIRTVMGWNPQSSTWAYINEHYSHFPEPLDAYADDMVIHELGHLYFGWGATLAAPEQNDWWFSFGAGLLFDRLVWNEKYKLPSPLFQAVIEKWSQDFSHRKEIDQRLVGPNTLGDEKNGLNRMQTFGHGKAYIYLSALRKQIGTDIFDSAIHSFLSKTPPQFSNYDQFISTLNPALALGIRRIETEFVVR
jgi:hypothetical protein